MHACTQTLTPEGIHHAGCGAHPVAMVKSSLVPDAKYLAVRAALKQGNSTLTRTNLFRRFAKGKLHSSDVVDFLGSLVHDGMYEHQDRFYNIGTRKDMKNASRDLWNAIWKEHLMHEFGDIYQTVECGRKNAVGDFEVHKYNIILPHLLCKKLHSMPRLSERTFVGKEGCLDTFWEHASQQPWFLEHPAAQQIAADPSHCIPLRIHGDAAPVTKKSSTLFMTFCSAVVHDLPSLQSRQLMLALDSKASPEMNEVLEIMAWSFKCLMDNKMPSHDHMGEPLQGPWAKCAGQSITGAYKLILCHVVGDWEFLRDYFAFDSHYNRDSICFLCPAVKSIGRTCAWCFGPDANWILHLVSNAEFMFSRRDVVPMCCLPGIHLDCIKLDLMHIIMLGILQYIIGSVMCELLRDNHWGPAQIGPWQERYATQLETAYGMFKDWARQRRLKHREPQFTVARLSITSLNSEPLWKGKAANTFKVGLWLADVCAQAAESEHNRLRTNVLFGVTQSVIVCKQAGHFLSDLEVRNLETCRQSCLYCFSALSHEAKRAGLLLWPLKPKLHMYDHAMRRAQRDRENPLSFWCFADEDFVGSMAKVCKSCHDSSRETQAIFKYLLLRSLSTLESDRRT